MAMNVNATLRAALAHLESEQARLTKQIGAIRDAVQATSDGRRPAARRRKSMSTAARRAVSQRMKAYWAKRRKLKPGTAKQSKAPAKT